MDWVDRPQNYKDLYGILQLLQGSHLDNFPLKTLKLGWVAFHSLTFQLKCLDFQSNFNLIDFNLVPRAFSSTIFKMADSRGESPGDEVESI